MKRKIIACMAGLWFVICAKLAFTYFYNEGIVSKYNRQDYSVSASPLQIFNVVEPYIAHYNNGNLYYREGKYQEAAEEFEKALTLKPPRFKECLIRVNLALSMLGLIDEDYASEENIEDTLKKLKEARDVLTEEGCAKDDGSGHSGTAEELKDEIDRLIEELTQNGGAGSSTSKEEPEEEEQEQKAEETQDINEEDIKEKLQENQSEAYQERESDRQFMEEFDLNINFDSDGVIW